MTLTVAQPESTPCDAALLRSTADGVLLVGRDLRIEEANDKALALVGLSRDEVLGRPIETFIHRGDRPGVTARAHSLSTGEVSGGVLRLEAGGWARGQVDVRARRMADGRLLVLLRDLPELRQQELACRRLSEVMAETQGPAFFDALADTLRSSLGADYAFVAETHPTRSGEMVVHALAGPHGIRRGLRLPVEGTSCDTALQSRHALHWSSSEAGALPLGLPADLDVAAGWLIPLMNREGTAVGVTGVLSRNDGLDDAAACATLTVAGSRAALEIDRIRLESELRRSERHLKTMVQASARFVWSVDSEGNPTLHSDHTWSSISGQDIDALGEDNDAWLQAVVPEDRDRVAAEWTSAFEARREHQLAYCVEAPDGSIRHLQVRGLPIFDEDGDFEGFIGTIEDVTALHEAARELESRNRALQALAAVPEATHNGAGFRECVAVAVEEICQLWAFERGSALVLDPATGDLVALDGDPSLFTDLMARDPEIASLLRSSDEVRRVGEPAHVLAPVRTRSETVAILDFECGAGMVCPEDVADVLKRVGLQLATARERERQEQEVAIARKQAFEAQKLEAVGRLAGGVAHEFNNRLTVVLGEAELALRQASLPQSARRSLREIRDSGRRARQITQHLLSFSQQEATLSGPLELCELVEELKPVGRDLIPAGVTIETLLPSESGVCTVRANRTLLEQTLLNVLVNAADAMPNGGRIAVRVGHGRVVEAAPDRSGPAPGRYTVVSVTDEGTGIPEDRLGLIFEPFFTTKPDAAGLGLASAYGYVTAAGGFIEVDSEVGIGTEIRIYLPSVTRDSTSPSRHT